MAEPWVYGAKHSTLYGARNCQVNNENIFIEFINSNDAYLAKYKIKYTINSDVNQTIPLLFIGLGLRENKLITVNNELAKIQNYETESSSEIRYSENDALSVKEEDLIYFEAKLNKGKNTILIEYDADLEHDRYGFLKTYKLKYSLYPSKYWESFGTIKLEIFLDDKVEINSSNIGEPKIENNIAKWEIKDITIDEIEIDFSTKPNFFSRLLLFIQPIGISILSLLLMSFLHIKLLKQKYKQQNTIFKHILYLGILIVPILFYVIYFTSYDLIDLSLGQHNSKHGYIFLFIFTMPLLMLIYGRIMYVIDKKLKSKYEKTAPNSR